MTTDNALAVTAALANIVTAVMAVLITVKLY